MSVVVQLVGHNDILFTPGVTVLEAKLSIREECNFVASTGVIKNSDNVTITNGPFVAGNYLFVGGIANTTSQAGKLYKVYCVCIYECTT